MNQLPRGTIELSPSGCLEAPELGELRTLLLDEAPKMAPGVLLNLSAVDKIDTAAMALVMLARIEIEAHGGALVVENARPAVRSSIDHAGLERFVTIADRRIDSLRKLRDARVAAA